MTTTPITASRAIQWMTAATTELSDRLRESKSVVDRPSDYSKAPSLTNIILTGSPRQIAPKTA